MIEEAAAIKEARRMGRVVDASRMLERWVAAGRASATAAAGFTSADASPRHRSHTKFSMPKLGNFGRTSSSDKMGMEDMADDEVRERVGKARKLVERESGGSERVTFLIDIKVTTRERAPRDRWAPLTGPTAPAFARPLASLLSPPRFPQPNRPPPRRSHRNTTSTAWCKRGC